MFAMSNPMYTPGNAAASKVNPLAGQQPTYEETGYLDVTFQEQH